MTNYQLQQNIAVSESGFLFLPSTGETFTLNEIGKNIVKMLQQNLSTSEIYKNMLDEYDIDEQAFDKDFTDFIYQLKSYSLLKEL